ncbi:universal protein YeaZ [Treponema sp. JC4]|jgi:tRNA threonylcarbamoyladenosine biosynthesis protein TsaB|uniref:tRNA (adenosine(37)-N6)-threonylcarbamoyltransferase complex dimerization subunit type 1 TsaB n=1 Tax=Treponema sp. JC4 TaxID=1124982 RepID=UPI00025B057B|nr:tRNA (adenosine(37)-N6)-threonylcarbamoyltransferase complex dimerization subunit type 1 TsaB [Treponema sp. JC4]EID84477.1 universal protein YeaZ [Treponema sp. JC4]
MKALAIDCAVTRLIVAAKNDDNMCAAVYDIGMKQSETIVNAVDYVLEKVGITAKELDYTCVTGGPGSFTGLRLGFSVLKALTLANGTPLYAISSLKIHAWPYLEADLPVLCGIDAKKDRFYANLTAGGKEILPDGDYELAAIVEKANQFEKIFVCGTDNKVFLKLLSENGLKAKVFSPKAQALSAESMFQITEKMIADGEKPLADYDGPVYLRASEAEVKLQERS